VGELGTVGELSGRDDTDVSHVAVIAHCIILIDGYDPSGVLCVHLFFFFFLQRYLSHKIAVHIKEAVWTSVSHHDGANCRRRPFDVATITEGVLS